MTERKMPARIGALIVPTVLAACGTVPHPQSANQEAAGYNVQLGLGYMQENKLEMAKEKLDRAQSEAPHDPKVHSAEGLLYERLGDPKHADEEYRTALRYGPKDPDIANNYAVFLCRQGRTDEGVKYFQEAAQNPFYRTPEVAYTNAGVCLRNAHRDEDAKQSLHRALTIRANFSEAAYQLADLEFERGHLLEARAALTHYTDNYDATADMLLLGVRIAQAQGDRIGAEHFSRSLRMEFPNSEQTRALSDLNQRPGS
jgi:type IV pilus assembly protein PilF